MENNLKRSIFGGKFKKFKKSSKTIGQPPAFQNWGSFEHSKNTKNGSKPGEKRRKTGSNLLKREQKKAALRPKSIFEVGGAIKNTEICKFSIIRARLQSKIQKFQEKKDEKMQGFVQDIIVDRGKERIENGGFSNEKRLSVEKKGAEPRIIEIL